MPEDKAENSALEGPLDGPGATFDPQWSILTVGPGGDPYALFGHNAIWLRDPALADFFTDPIAAQVAAREGVVFDFGVFDDSQPGFMGRYLKGTQHYLLSQRSMGHFLSSYTEEGRWVVCQDLHLTPAESEQLKQSLLSDFEHLGCAPNQPDAGYVYRFLDDNCTTRISDWLSEVHALPPSVRAWPVPHTRREALDVHLVSHPWIHVGADLVTGRHADMPLTGPHAAFLPVLLRDQLAAQTDWVAPPRILVPPPSPAAIPTGSIIQSGPSNGFAIRSGDLGLPPPAFNSPLVTFWLGASILALLSLRCWRRPLQGRPYLDAVFFLILGLLGCLIAFLGLWSEHPEFKGFNFNLLWLWPTHALLAPALLAAPRLARIYAKIAALGLLATALAWFFLPQHLPTPLYPLALLSALRLLRLGFGPATQAASGASGGAAALARG